MKGSKGNYVMVGGFVMAMLAALVFSIALLSGRTGAIDSYYTIYNNVSGINFGTRVLFEGYHVGQVEEVVPVVVDGAMRFRVDMSVVEGWQIPVDSVARKEAGGLLAAVTIAIRAGDSKEMVEPNGMIQAGVSANLFDAMSEMAAEAGDVTRTGLRPLLENMNRQIDVLGELLEEDIPNLLAGLNVTASVVAEKVPVIAANFEEFSQALVENSRRLDALLKEGDALLRKGGARVEKFLSDENAENVGMTLANVEKGTQGLVELIEDFRATNADLDGMIQAVNELIAGNRENVGGTMDDVRYSMRTVARHIDAILRNLEGSSRNMYEFSRQIRLNPGLLLGGSPPRDEAAWPAPEKRPTRETR